MLPLNGPKKSVSRISSALLSTDYNYNIITKVCMSYSFRNNYDATKLIIHVYNPPNLVSNKF